MTSPDAPSEPKVWRAGTLTYTTGALALLFFWLLWGDFAWSARDRSVPQAVQLLFKKFGASDTVVGILFSSLPAALGFFLGPIVAYKSDRYRSRWGRRIPFLIVPTPFIVASVVGLAFSPQIGAFLHRLGTPGADADATVLVCLGLFWTLFEIGCVTANSVFYALINDVVPQEIIGRFFGFFRAASLSAGVILSFWVMGKVETHYVWIFLGVGGLYAVGFTLMCLKVKEGHYPPPPVLPPSEQAKGTAVASVRAYFRDSFSKPYYLLVFIAPMLCNLAIVPFNTYSVFYAKSLGMDMTLFNQGLGISYIVSLALAYPLGALVDRLHPLRISLIVAALYGGFMAWGMIWAKDAHSFFILLIGHCVLSGTYFTTSPSIGMRLLPRSKFAELSSAGGLIGSVAAMILPIALGTLLDRTGHSYLYICHVAVALSFSGVLLGIVLYRRFVALGGPDNYRAPE